MTKDHQNLNIQINGRTVRAQRGETVAAALIRAGIHTFRHTANDAPRGIFCGMGVCFDCLVTIDEIPDQRACMRLVQPEMKISTKGKRKQ